MTIRLMIVDDNYSFRKAMHALLSIEPDMQVVAEAEDGRMALDMLEKYQPEMVLVDAQISGLTGMDVTREIKRRFPQVRVILMTIYPDYRGKVNMTGADATLTKGISLEHMLSVIRGVHMTQVDHELV
jgi:DNA-binding NarL/FixJ family response regulator